MKEVVSARVPVELANQCRKMAQAHGNTLAAEVEMAMREHVELRKNLGEAVTYARAAALISAYAACGRRANAEPEKLVEEILAVLKGR